VDKLTRSELIELATKHRDRVDELELLLARLHKKIGRDLGIDPAGWLYPKRKKPGRIK